MNSEGCGVMDQGGREVLIFFPGILPLSIFGASLVQISLDHKGTPDSRFTRNTQHGEDSLSSGKNSLPGSFPGCWAGRRVCAAQPEFRQETECPLSLRADLPLFSSSSLGVLPYASRLGGAGGTPTPLRSPSHSARRESSLSPGALGSLPSPFRSSRIYTGWCVVVAGNRPRCDRATCTSP